MKIKKDYRHKNISFGNIMESIVPIICISAMVLCISVLLGFCYAILFVLIGSFTHPLIGILPSACICIFTGLFFGEQFDNNNRIFTDEVIASLIAFLSAIIGTIIICLATNFI